MSKLFREPKLIAMLAGNKWDETSMYVVARVLRMLKSFDCKQQNKVDMFDVRSYIDRRKSDTTSTYEAE